MSSRKTIDKGRPDYYLTPTRDFTQYTRDSEEKYWSKDTKFNWQQCVPDNLKAHLEKLDPQSFSEIFFLVLPMVNDTVSRKLAQIRQAKLPLDEDALKDIAECIPFDRTTIYIAIKIQSPLINLQSAVTTLEDRLGMVTTEFLELSEQQRLGYIKQGIIVKPIETAAEKDDQAKAFSLLTQQLHQTQTELTLLKQQYKPESEKLKTNIRAELNIVEPQILLDLEETLSLLQRTIQAGTLPGNAKDLERLKDLVLKRQLRGLKDIANHALVVEQSAIAPLTMGIIHYKRYREIQEAMTTFINDEAKHSATFRRFLVEKLEAKEYISAILIRGATRYMWLARFMPGAGLFLAVIVEAIGAAYLEFFGNEKYMPDPLFCSISKTISDQDETRHMDLCVAMYNELFRKGTKWEQVRNRTSLRVMMKSVYGDKTDDHHLIQAFRAFGVASDVLYSHIIGRLSAQLARIGMYVTSDELLEMIGRKPIPSNV